MIWLFGKEEKIQHKKNHGFSDNFQEKKCWKIVFCWYLNIHVKVLYVYVYYIYIYMFY